MGQIWDEFPSQIISNCWKKTGLLDEKLIHDNARIEDVDGAKEIETDLNNLIRELAPAFSRMSIQNVLCRDDNEPCVQEFSVENLLEQAVPMMDESDDGKSAHTASDPNEDCYVKPPSIEEKLKPLSITKWILDDGQFADKAAIRSVVHSKMHLRHLKSVFMKQRRIT